MKETLSKIAAIEPARVRAVIAAVVGLLASLGVVVSDNLSGAAEAVIIGLLTLLPLALGESIRGKVSPAIEAPNSVEVLDDLTAEELTELEEL